MGKLNTEYKFSEVKVGQDQYTSLFLCLKTKKKGLRSMSKLFMYGTSLEGIEQLMVMVSNFQPRRSGIAINNYFNCQGGLGNCNCNDINTNRDWNKCGYIGLNLKTNVGSFRSKDLVKECFGRINNYFLTFFRKQDVDIYDISSRFIAILFLLTAET